MTSELGDYLRARRAACRPEDVALPAGSGRRVPGLRRAEVAVLAGVSVEYFTKIEQGREQRPSAQVLHALSAALRLNVEQQAHLFRLGGLAVVGGSTDATAVAPSLRRLLDGWPDHPAVIVNPAYDVLARNTLGGAFYSGFARHDNIIRAIFLDSFARTFYVDHDLAARTAVGNLRRAQGRFPRDRRVAELATELTDASTDFARLWAERDVAAKTRDAKRFRHPDVGELELNYEAFGVHAAPGQELLVYHAEPDSPSELALRRLGR